MQYRGYLLCICSAIIIALGLFVLMRCNQPPTGRVIWSASAGSSPPDRFLFLLFPVRGAKTYANAALIGEPKLLQRPVLNEWSEHYDNPIMLGGPSGTLEYVARDQLSELPLSSQGLQQQLDRIVSEIGTRVTPPITDLRLSIDRSSSIPMVELKVRKNRQRFIYRYAIENSQIVPKDWLAY